MKGMVGKASCGHDGECVVANYYQCLLGCDSVRSEKLYKTGDYEPFYPVSTSGEVPSHPSIVFWYNGCAFRTKRTAPHKSDESRNDRVYRTTVDFDVVWPDDEITQQLKNYTSVDEWKREFRGELGDDYYTCDSGIGNLK